ncbi:hypothetical protein K438DRAFT_1749610 [Mycena galopus ATCC 62051]|nr:hypothetical protein K438DRAFT_1749610 [Mycena galopus ATCC 62051]
MPVMPLPSVPPLTFLPGSGSLLGLEISTLRTTRSCHAFGSWKEIPTNFSFTDAVAAAAVAVQCDEDLAELDTGTPSSLLSPIPVTPFGQPTTPTPTTRIQRDKLRSKVKCRDARPAVKVLADPLCDPRPSRHQRHIRAAAPPITAQFRLRKTRIAATGFIGLRDNGGCINWLQDLFGDKPKHKGFRLVKSSGSTPRPIVDRDGKVCAVYGGMPDDEGFMTCVHDPAVRLWRLLGPKPPSVMSGSTTKFCATFNLLTFRGSSGSTLRLQYVHVGSPASLFEWMTVLYYRTAFIITSTRPEDSPLNAPGADVSTTSKKFVPFLGMNTLISGTICQNIQINSYILDSTFDLPAIGGTAFGVSECRDFAFVGGRDGWNGLFDMAPTKTKLQRCQAGKFF